MTPILKIDRHNILIYNLHGNVRDELKQSFSIPVPNFWFAKQQMLKKAQRLRAAGSIGEGNACETRAKNWDGTKKFVWDYKTHLKLPSGLINDVLGFFAQREIEISIEDSRVFLPHTQGDVELIGIDLRPYQQQAIQIMAERGCGILMSATGSGKTEIAAGLIKKLNTPKTLFLTHRNLLETQAKNRLEKRLNIDIGVIGGKKLDIQQVTIGMVPTLFNHIKKENKETIAYLNSVELVIGDEIHLGTSESWIKVFKQIKNPNIYGLSGTPFKKSIIDDTELIATVGSEIFKISAKWLIDNGYLTPPILKIVPYRHENTEGIDYEDVIDLHVVRNVARNNLIKQIVEMDKNNNKQTLVLVNIIEHGEILLELLKEYKPKLIHSKLKRSLIDSTLTDFINNKENLLISTPLLDIGVDIPSLDKLILSGSGKALTSILQRIGRSLRVSEGKVTSEVYDIVDLNQSYLSDHAKERVLIYNDPDQQFKLELFDIGNYWEQQEKLL